MPSTLAWILIFCYASAMGVSCSFIALSLLHERRLGDQSELAAWLGSGILCVKHALRLVKAPSTT
eukprot:1803260-Pleurochrysis_carterae.AAC.2